MLHIAVCDDDPADLREVQGHLEAYLQAILIYARLILEWGNQGK